MSPLPPTARRRLPTELNTVEAPQTEHGQGRDRIMEQALEVLAQGRLLHVKISGKLTRESYEALAPLADEQIQENGKIRILLELHDFHGWTAGAMWEDLKFDYRHWNHIEQLAIVGESKWEQGMAMFCKPFTSAKIRYFDHTALAEAQAWVEPEA